MCGHVILHICLQSSGTDKYVSAGSRSFHVSPNRDQQVEDHYSGSGGLRITEDVVMIEGGKASFLERRENTLQEDIIATLQRKAREESHQTWETENAQRWTEESGHTENWTQLSGREETREGDQRFREDISGDGRNYMITVNRHGREDPARHSDRVVVQEELRKKAESDLMEQKWLRDEARQKDEEFRRDEARIRERDTRKEEAKRRDETRRREEERRRDETRHREERRREEDRHKKEEEKRKAEDKRRKEERLKEEEQKEREAKIALLREAEKHEASQIAELLNKLDELKASGLSRQEKRKEEKEEIAKQRVMMKERAEKEEENEDKRMQEIEKSQVKLDMEFAAKQELVAQQWEKFLKETEGCSTTERVKQGKASANLMKVKPQEKKSRVSAKSSPARTSQSKSTQPKQLSSPSKSERTNKPVSTVPGRSGRSNAASRSLPSKDVKKLEAGKERQSGTGACRKTSAVGVVDEKGSKVTRKVIKVKKCVKVGNVSEGSVNFGAKASPGRWAEHSKAPIGKGFPMEPVQVPALYSSKMDEIAASLSQFAKAAKEKSRIQHTATATTVTDDDDVSETDFIDASESRFMEEQLLSSRQQNLNGSKRQVSIPGLDLEDNSPSHTTKRSGQHLAPLNTTRMRSRAGGVVGMHGDEGGVAVSTTAPSRKDDRGSSGRSHLSREMPPSKIGKRSREEERRMQGNEDTARSRFEISQGSAWGDASSSGVLPNVSQYDEMPSMKRERLQESYGRMGQEAFDGQLFPKPSPNSARWFDRDVGTPHQAGGNGNYLETQW